jgi:aryl-alcohol dehydrogenase-like predicted oxidoreductase
LQDNVKALDVTLDADMLKAIDEALDGLVTTDPAKTQPPTQRP